MTVTPREPNGRPSHPCVLIEGGPKVGKSWMVAQFTGNPRLGDAYWIDLAEGDGELYGKIDGARYKMLDHDGTFRGILEVVEWARDRAKEAHERGDKPVVLAIDQIGSLWALLSTWARNRAMESRANKKILADDANAEINVGHTYWNAATERWNRIMTILLTFPGVVLLISRGRVVSAFDDKGDLVKGQQDYRVEGHGSLIHAVNIHVRIYPDKPAAIVGGRSTKVDMRGDVFRPTLIKDGFSLEWLIFDAFGYDSATARVRAGMELHPGSDAPESEMARVIALAIDSAEDLDQLKAAHGRIKPAIDQQQISEIEATALYAAVTARKPKFAPPATVNGHEPALAGVAK